MERITSGIEKLDDLLSGGFVKNSNILVAGCAGIGKTTLAAQYLYSNALLGRKCMFISAEPHSIIKSFLPRFQHLGKLIKNRRIIFAEIAQASARGFIKDVKFAVKSYNPENVVLDSMPILKMLPQNEARFVLSEISHFLKKSGCTTVFITEAPQNSKNLSFHGVEEFVSDTVISLEVNSHKLKKFHIRKMRGSAHSEKVHSYEVLHSGIEIGD